MIDLLVVMAGLVPAIHVFLLTFIAGKKDVDARDKRGHDGARRNTFGII
jgi:hypothetical protein